MFFNMFFKKKISKEQFMEISKEQLMENISSIIEICERSTKSYLNHGVIEREFAEIMSDYADRDDIDMDSYTATFCSQLKDLVLPEMRELLTELETKGQYSRERLLASQYVMIDSWSRQAELTKRVSELPVRVKY